MGVIHTLHFLKHTFNCKNVHNVTIPCFYFYSVICCSKNCMGKCSQVLQNTCYCTGLRTHVLDRKNFVCLEGHVRRDREVLSFLSLVLHARLIAMVIFTVTILFSSISNLVFNVHFPNKILKHDSMSKRHIQSWATGRNFHFISSLYI